MSFFEEYIHSLTNKNIPYKILNQGESNAVFEMLEKNFPITNWGQIDWDKWQNKKICKNYNEVIHFIYNKGKNNFVYVMWGEASLPCVECRLIDCALFLHEILMVSYDTWIFSKNHDFVIEFYHEGDITIGFQ